MSSLHSARRPWLNCDLADQVRFHSGPSVVVEGAESEPGIATGCLGLLTTSSLPFTGSEAVELDFAEAHGAVVRCRGTLREVGPVVIT